jgi:hypothetical protein
VTSIKPPNLKAAKACGDCKAFNGTDECVKYHYPVGDEEHCDTWTPADPREAAKRAWGIHRRRLAKGA